MYKTIDLFAGIGGIRRGYEMTGHFENVLSAEIDSYACVMYEHIFGINPYNDVTTEEFKAKVENTVYDTLLAGFPCQAFSRAGKQEGFMDSTRGTLFFDIADIISRTRPKSFMLENVDNLLSHDKGNTFKTILEVLIKELNYKIIGVDLNLLDEFIYERNSFIRNSRHFGIPQNRPRMYIVGFDRNYYGDHLNELPIGQLPTKREKPKIYRDLNDLLEFKAPAEFYIAEGYLETLKKHKERHMNRGNGFGYMVVNEPSIREPYSNAILATGGSGKERNLVYDPQDGIAGKIVKHKQTPLNSENIRHMTPREWGKLQGFINYGFLDEKGEEEFEFPSQLSNTQLYKQFGNSVTIPVIEEIAYYMYHCLDFLDGQMEKYEGRRDAV